jgi:UMF1 family MFS transporter
VQCTEDAPGSFIPITIEQLARERGVLSTDPTVPCSKSMNHTSSGHSTSPSGPIATPQCVIHILGLEINTASFAMYTFSISVFVQFLLIISMSGAADHGSYRKSLLIIFATTGAIACMLFLPITPQVVLLGALLAIVANTCFGASSVLLNSFLPLLVRNHPDIRGPELDYSGATPESGTPEEDSTEHDAAPNQAAAPSNSGEDAHLADFSTPPITALDISTRISSIGVGIGYIAALIVQSIAIYVVRATGSTLSSLRLAIFIIGAWWLLFTIPGAMWLRPRPGPPLHISHSAGRVRTLLAYASYSWKSLGYSLMRARKLKDVLIFLAAWFLLSDAIATVTGTAVLFAKTTLGMSLGGLALINVVVTISGILGAFAWRHLADMMGLKPSHTVLLCILIFELVPLYGLLGYLPIFKQWGVGGLQQGWEMYPLSVVFGFVLGGLSSFCRSIFGELVPPGFETAFYSLYAITDKGSSIFGPAIVGAITDATGEIRPVSNRSHPRFGLKV